MKRFLQINFCLGPLLFCSNAFSQMVVYENLAPSDWTIAYPADRIAENEFGDEVTLAPGPRIISSFAFQYFGQNLSGGETVVLRFYANDGPFWQESPPEAPRPGTVLYTSDPLSVLNNRHLLTLEDLNVSVPDTFTWTVEFTGLSGDERAGLAISGPPSLGSSYNDYWEKTATGWDLYGNLEYEGQPLYASFGAQFTAVPEPREYALWAGLGLLGFAVWRRASVRRLGLTA
jgi:hypothetical protein